ncbi:glycosyltransferase family 17 protein [Rickenella mellea]|uniref:Glycosyltransferase family 17 protein n=1 Tax=Rickenella mellea TaxID=50990 RepID=A0A4Y7Q5H8_9AGAM|nr:glycosyltransferase family 17 protein [Rickenella mellea]
MLAGRRRFFALCTVLTLFLVVIARYRYQLQNLLSYASRPLWDTSDGPRQILPHYHADGIEIDEKLCQLHGWKRRAERDAPQLWDAVLFSGELDLLEIRMHELRHVVDKFFILESNRTFTGLPKPLYFANARQRFAAFEGKIVYTSLPGPSSESFKTAEDRDPWKWENHQRDTLSQSIRNELRSMPRAPLVLMSDVDEIPSAHTMALLRGCAFQSPLHLQMREYLYSFEWPRGWLSWRAQVHEWGDRSYYRHSMAGDVAIADAGWHCSFCFRKLDQMIMKMQGYSHADRIGGDKSLLSPERIQKVICQGKDIFNMLPEAYSYKDMIQLMNPEPSKSIVGLPRFLIENADRFRFLLPGGCKREDGA